MVVEENTPKKRLCSRVAQVAEAGPEGVQEVKPKKSSVRATQGPVTADHAIGSASRVVVFLFLCLLVKPGCFFDLFVPSCCTSSADL